MSNYFRIVKVDGRESAAFSYGGKAVSVDDSSPRYGEIRKALLDNDYKAAYELYNVIHNLSSKFEDVTDRVSFKGNSLYFDRERIDGPVVDTILKYRDEGHDFQPLVRFLEKLYVNNNEVIREHLYRWVSDRGLTITDEGDILGYKGVYRTSNGFRSSAQGQAVVDGVEHKGHIPQRIGSVVEMPRNEVTFDPTITCSSGLHVGSYEYAKAYGDTLVRVLVNPRDVVSVPVDYSGQKMRVCRYKLDSEHQEKVESALYKVKEKPVERTVYVYNVPSGTKVGVVYDVEWTNEQGVRSCTCPGWKYRSECRHINEVRAGMHQYRRTYDEQVEPETKTATKSTGLKPGQRIVSRKGVEYKVEQVKSNRVLLKELATGLVRSVSLRNLPKSFKVTKAEIGL